MPGRGWRSAVASRSRRQTRYAAVPVSWFCWSGGRAEDERIEEGDPTLELLDGLLPLQERLQLLGLPVRRQDWIVVGEQLPVVLPDPGSGVAPNDAGAALDLDQEEADWGQEQEIHLVDAAIISDELGIRPGPVRLPIREPRADEHQGIPLSGELRLCDCVPICRCHGSDSTRFDTSTEAVLPHFGGTRGDANRLADRSLANRQSPKGKSVTRRMGRCVGLQARHTWPATANPPPAIWLDPKPLTGCADMVSYDTVIGNTALRIASIRWNRWPRSKPMLGRSGKYVGSRQNKAGFGSRRPPNLT